MQDLNLQLQDGGVLNSVYDKIYNCRVVKPTYHKNAVSSQKIMLDKRFGLSQDFGKINYKFTDTILVDGEKYYYGVDNNTSKGYISNKDGLHIYEVPVNENSPLRVARGTGAGGQLILERIDPGNNVAPTIASSIPASAPDEVKIIHDDNVKLQKQQPSYKDTDPDNGGFVKLTVPGCTAGQYITFCSGILKGAVNKIWFVENDDIYILGTNIRGTLPEADVQYRIFSESRETIVLGAADGLHVVSITDRDNSSENKYIISLAPGQVDHWTFKVDSYDVIVTESDIDLAMAEIDAALPATYVVEKIDNLIHISRDDGSIINFSELYTGVLVDTQMIGNDAYGTKSFGGFKMNLDGNIIVSTAQASFDNTSNTDDYVVGRYINISDEDKEYGYQYFYKLNMLNDINSKLPAGYTGQIITVAGDSTFTHRETFDSSGSRTWISQTFDHNKRLFIKKDDNTSVTCTAEEFYYSFMYFDDRSKTVAGYTGVTLTLNGIDFTASPTSPNSYHHGIGVTLRNLIADDPTYRVTDRRYDSDRNEGGFLVSRVDGGPLEAVLSYPGTDPGEVALSNYTTTMTYSNSRYTVANPYSANYNTLNINAVNAYGVKSIVDENILDVVNYNGVIYAMTNASLYYSRLTFDDNTSFYPLDKFPYKGGTKLVPFGKVLLVMGTYNKIITTTTTQLNGVEGVVTYRINDLEYNGNLFSRYAYLFDEGAMYVLQSDKTLVQLNVSQKDSNTFTITTNELSRTYRWLFENIEGECYVTRHENYLNFLVVNNGVTENYKFNLSLQSWIIDRYTTEVYHIGDKVLTGGTDIGRVCTQEGFKDFGEDYEQEVNFSLGNLIKYTRSNIIRTIFGLDNKDKLEVNLTVDFEIGNGNSYTKEYFLGNYEFDSINGQDEDDLLDEPTIEYSGSLVSVQNTLEHSGRFIRFKYKSPNRFILGDSYFLTSESKPYVNELGAST